MSVIAKELVKFIEFAIVDNAYLIHMGNNREGKLLIFLIQCKNH